MFVDVEDAMPKFPPLFWQLAIVILVSYSYVALNPIKQSPAQLPDAFDPLKPLSKDANSAIQVANVYLQKARARFDDALSLKSENRSASCDAYLKTYKTIENALIMIDSHAKEIDTKAPEERAVFEEFSAKVYPYISDCLKSGHLKIVDPSAS